MVKSKRNKKVTLSQVQKKPSGEKKTRLLEDLRECLDKYEHVFIFSTQNMRNSPLKDLRTKWGSSRFFLGKNKVMQRALGLDEESAYSENAHLVSAHLKGPDKGLFFTNEDFDEVKTFFESFSVSDYARSGFKASETVTIPEGKLTQFSHSLEPHLRSLGMPVSLKNGVIELSVDYTICEEGKRLTPEQARLLKLFEIQMSEFMVILCCHLSEGKYTEWIPAM
jgi:mRNA turnover protein 4